LVIFNRQILTANRSEQNTGRKTMTLKNTSGKLHLVMIGVSAAALMHASAGFAQDTPNAKTTASDAEDGLEEIVVTAQKRSENIRDVPISITSVSGDMLEKRGVTNNLQLTESVPGLRMERVGNSTIPAIRGVSTFTTLPGTSPNVAVYLDNIYLGSSTTGTFDLPDVSRIDVLKGPQGTLFGRNATGGAIQIFTKDPNMDALGGDFSVSYGNFNTLALKGFVSAPIVADKLAVSVSGFRITGDNYNKNLVPSVPLQKINNYLVRAKVLFTPTENTRVLLIGYTSEQRGALTTQFSAVNGVTLTNAFPGSIIPTKPHQAASNLRQTETVKAKGVSLQINQKTSAGDFTVIGSWDKSSNLGESPAFAGALAGGFKGINYLQFNYDKSYAAEANFASKKFGMFSFIAGANYYHNLNGWNPLMVEVDLPGGPISYTSLFGQQRTNATGVYGEATLDITNELTLIGGIRYSREKRTLLGSVLPGFIMNGPLDNWGSKTFESVTQRASLRYRITPDTNVYFTYSTGFKSGNWDATTIPFLQTPASCAAGNASTPGSCALPIVVKPEKITAFEVGLKSSVTRNVNVDFALFYNRLSDIQILNFQNVCVQAPCPPNPTVSLGQLSNAATAKMYGAELAVDARLSRELRVSAGISVLDASFTSFPGAVWNTFNGTNFSLDTLPPQSAAGKQMPRAPKATATLSATYTKELPAGEFSFTVNGYASERIYYDVGNVFSQKPYATLGLSASFSPAAVPGLTVTAWGVNITDTNVILADFYNNNGANQAYQAPATYGARIGYKF
jgi:iron complex outermembrane receptor protein